MSIIFDSIKTRNIDLVYEMNLRQYYTNLIATHVPECKIVDNNSFVAFFTGINHPNFNVILQSDFDENESEDVINEVKALYSDAGLDFTWLDFPNSDPRNLGSLLKKHGLRYVGDDVIVGIELDNIVRKVKAPSSMFVEAINSFEKLEKWVDVYCTARNLRGDIPDKLKKIYEGVNFEDPNLSFRKYIGWLNDEPVAASTLVISSGIAVSYDESLLPKFKGWGIEDAISIVPLKKAKEMGYRLGLIATSLGNMKRFTEIGFVELFKVGKYTSIQRASRRRRR